MHCSSRQARPDAAANEAMTKATYAVGGPRARSRASITGNLLQLVSSRSLLGEAAPHALPPAVWLVVASPLFRQTCALACRRASALRT